MSLGYNNLLYESRGNQMIPTFQATCKSRATRLGVPPSPDELAAFDQSENLTSMLFKQLYSVLGLPLVQNKKKLIPPTFNVLNLIVEILSFFTPLVLQVVSPGLY